MKFLVSAFFALLLTVSALGVRDAHALNFGRVAVNPSLDFSTLYDDNVFRTNTPFPGVPNHDWCFLISPGLKLTVPQRENWLEFSYRGDIYRWVDTGKQNDVVDHYLSGAAVFNFPGGMSINVGDQATKSHEFFGDSNPLEIKENINHYYSNGANAQIVYAFADRYKIALGYKNFIIDYELPDQKYRDQFDNAATLTLFYQLMPKTSALVDVSYNRVDHDNGNESVQEVARRLNNNEYWARAGLTWNITDKSTGTIKGGYEWKLFDYSGSKGFSSPVFEVTIDHFFNAMTAIKLSGLRQAFETNDIHVDYYTATTGSIELSYKPLTKIEIKPRGSYSYNVYSQEITVGTQTAIMRNGYWRAGADLTYYMNKWIAVSLGYTYSKRVSNFSGFNYTDNLSMIKLMGKI